MKFDRSEDAILFGMQATRQDCTNLKKAIVAYQIRYNYLKTLKPSSENFNRRMKIATWQQLCHEALEVSR